VIPIRPLVVPQTPKKRPASVTADLFLLLLPDQIIPFHIQMKPPVLIVVSENEAVFESLV
jgi:hypothetical protein